MGEDYPVMVKEDGIIVKPTMMKKEEIYYCVYRNKVYLFFKDENELLNCYEVEDKEVAEAIKASPDSDSIKNILQEYAKKQR
jgi:hypothetical protein